MTGKSTPLSVQDRSPSLRRGPPAAAEGDPRGDGRPGQPPLGRSLTRVLPPAGELDRRVVLDLRDVTLADRDAVSLLARSEADGARLDGSTVAQAILTNSELVAVLSASDRPALGVAASRLGLSV